MGLFDLLKGNVDTNFGKEVSKKIKLITKMLKKMKMEDIDIESFDTAMSKYINNIKEANMKNDKVEEAFNILKKECDTIIESIQNESSRDTKEEWKKNNIKRTIDISFSNLDIILKNHICNYQNAKENAKESSQQYNKNVYESEATKKNDKSINDTDLEILKNDPTYKKNEENIGKIERMVESLEENINEMQNSSGLQTYYSDLSKAANRIWDDIENKRKQENIDSEAIREEMKRDMEKRRRELEAEKKLETKYKEKTKLQQEEKKLIAEEQALKEQQGHNIGDE